VATCCVGRVLAKANTASVDDNDVVLGPKKRSSDRKRKVAGTVSTVAFQVVRPGTSWPCIRLPAGRYLVDDDGDRFVLGTCNATKGLTSTEEYGVTSVIRCFFAIERYSMQRFAKVVVFCKMLAAKSLEAFQQGMHTSSTS
jgi:hypothetical protein